MWMVPGDVAVHLSGGTGWREGEQVKRNPFGLRNYCYCSMCASYFLLHLKMSASLLLQTVQREIRLQAVSMADRVRLVPMPHMMMVKKIARPGRKEGGERKESDG